MKLLVSVVLLITVLPLSSGCSFGKYVGYNSQPYLTPDRKENGWVLVFTGIEGRSRFNESIADGLAKAGVNYAIQIVDWTPSPSAIYNLESQERNRRIAAQWAVQVENYRMTYPHRPVILVGQSGGGAIAAWVAEALDEDKVDGIVMLAATLSPGYRLDKALAGSERGIVNFYSERDVLMLGIGTTLFRTMDGEFRQSAGRVGFEVPRNSRPYQRLYQVPWTSEMAKATGNYGLHLTSGSENFVAKYVAPLVMARRWNHAVVQRAVYGDNETSAYNSDLRARVR